MKIPVTVDAEIDLTHNHLVKYVYRNEDTNSLYWLLHAVAKRLLKMESRPDFDTHKVGGSNDQIALLLENLAQHIRNEQPDAKYLDSEQVQAWSAATICRYIQGHMAQAAQGSYGDVPIYVTNQRDGQVLEITGCNTDKSGAFWLHGEVMLEPED